MGDRIINKNKSKEDADKTEKRCSTHNLKRKRLVLSAHRFSNTKKRRESRKLKKAVCLTLSQVTSPKEDNSADTFHEVVLASTSAVNSVPTNTICQEDVGNLEEVPIVEKTIEEIIEKVQFDTEEQQTKEDEIQNEMPEDNHTILIDEISSVRDMNEERNEDIEDCTDNDCTWVVEKDEPQQSKQTISEGIEFTDFSYIFQQIKNLQQHSTIGCGIEHFQIIKCQQYGLEKTYSVQCQMCNHVERISCLRQSNDSMDINHAAVSATMVTGGGYNQLEELLSGVNVSCMSKRIYEKCQNDIIDAFEVAAQREMEDAAKEERELAIARGDVLPECNIPWIAVVADGSWMKRSYRGGDYNSLSGVGVIVGYNTKKVLYVNVKNKFCMICQTAAKKKEEAHEHRCFKNWGRNQSSTGMESAAIIEGFKCSIEMHGLVYSILVADGDSSMYKKILDNDPYKEYMVHVRKIECTNHLLRNFSRKINDIGTKGRYKELRAVVKANALRLRTSVKKAAEYRFKEKLRLADQIKNLKEDMKNVPSHVFGEHKECQRLAYFCKKYSDSNIVNYVPQLMQAGIFQSIQEAMQPLFVQAESLLYSLNNNAVESFNNIIAKFIGGKRINFGRRGSYQGRISAAVVQFNTKEAFSKVSTAMNKQPTTIVKRMEERRKHAAEMAIKYKQEAKASSFRNEKQSCDQDYGPSAEKPDMDKAVYFSEC